MYEKGKLSPTQQKFFDELMKPESSWPEELRDRFNERKDQLEGYQPNLDREVVSEFIRERVS